MTKKKTPATNNAPTHIAYQLSKGGQRSYWTRIGVAFAHKDRKGFNLILECLPTDGKITLRIPSENKSESE